MSSTISIVGCGWLGMPLGERLAKAGYRVKGSSRSEDKFAQMRAGGMIPHQLELTPSLKGDTSGVLDTDILFINIPPSKGDGEAHFYLRQMQALASAAEIAGVRKVIFVSATSVYPQNNEEVREEDAVREISQFSDTAWLDIEEVFTLNPNFETTVLRFSGLIGGEYQPGRYFSGREMAGADDPVNMIHREDCIGIIQTVISKDTFGETFNASADEHPSRRELYTRSCTIMGIEPPTFIEGERPWRLVNCDKLKKMLDYTFVFPDPLTALKQ